MRRRLSPRANSRNGFAFAAGASLILATSAALADNAVVPDLPARPALRGALDAPLQLEVFINGRSHKIIAEFVRLSGGQFAATRHELADAGLKPPVGLPNDLVKLESVAGLKYRYDEPGQAIYFDAPLELVAPQRFSFGGSREPAGPATSDYGAAVNYDLFASSSAWSQNNRLTFGGASLALDARVFTPYGVATQSGVLGTTLTSQATALRLDTRIQFDDEKRDIVYRAGDVVNSGLSWTRPIRMGGLQIQHDFSTRPDLVVTATPTASGTAAVPTSVDVFVNNFKVFTQDVEPGPFRIDGLPAIGGNGNTTLVMHDATGKEVTQSLPFFATSKMLIPGAYQYEAEAGFARQYYGTQSFSYGKDVVGSASFKGGVNDWATLEAHAEGGAGLVNGGAGVVLNAFNRGIVEAALAGSHFGGKFGLQPSIEATTTLFGVNIDLASQRTFGPYADLAMATAPTVPSPGSTLQQAGRAGFLTSPFFIATSIAPPKALDRITLNFPLYRQASANVSLINLEQRSGPASRIVSAGISQPIGSFGSAFANAFVDTANRANAGVIVGLSMSFGPNINAQSQASLSRSTREITNSASKSAGLDPGSYGWQVADTEGTNRYSSAGGAYQSQYGRGTVSVGEYGVGGTASGVGTVDFAGSVAAMGGAVRLGPTAHDAIGLVDAGAPGVKVFEDNRQIGVTDFGGKLLVSGLRSYQDNRLSIDPTSVPANAQVGLTETLARPKAMSGVVVDFKVSTSGRDAEIILKDEKGAIIPASATVELAGSTQKGIVGYEGRTYLGGLEGHNALTVKYDGRACDAAFDFKPNPAKARQTVGPFICKWRS